MIDTLRLAQGQRLIAISDVHGHIRQLHALLDKVRYCDADALVFVGDYIERGAQSLPVLEFVAQLYARNPQNVRLLLGNWELYILSAIEKGDCALLYKNRQRLLARAGNTLYGEMCARLGLDADSEAAMRAAHPKVLEKFGALIRFFLERPIVLDAGGNGIRARRPAARRFGGAGSRPSLQMYRNSMIFFGRTAFSRGRSSLAICQWSTAGAMYRALCRILTRAAT